MAVVLTDQQLTFLAKSCAWKFDLSTKDARSYNDSVVYTGSGVGDLDRLIDRLHGLRGNTLHKLTVDVGSLFSSYVAVTVDDVIALRAKYVAIFGPASRPGFPFDVALTQSTREIEPYVTTGTVVTGEAFGLPGGDPALGTPNPSWLQTTGDWQDYGDGRANRAPVRTQGSATI